MRRIVLPNIEKEPEMLMHRQPAPPALPALRMPTLAHGEFGSALPIRVAPAAPNTAEVVQAKAGACNTVVAWGEAFGQFVTAARYR